jgi:hypothetical protein
MGRVVAQANYRLVPNACPEMIAADLSPVMTGIEDAGPAQKSPSPESMGEWATAAQFVNYLNNITRDELISELDAVPFAWERFQVYFCQKRYQVYIVLGRERKTFVKTE